MRTTNLDRPYVPIDCGAHDRLLALATLRRECVLTFEASGAEGDDGVIRMRAVIVDVYTRDAAEFLRLSNGMVLRLDRIRDVDGEPVLPADL